MICGNDASRTPHMIHMYLDAAQVPGSALAGVEGLRDGGGRTRIRLTTTYSLSGTKQSTNKAQDGTLVSSKQFSRMVAPTGRHSLHRTLPLAHIRPLHIEDTTPPAATHRASDATSADIEWQLHRRRDMRCCIPVADDPVGKVRKGRRG